MSSTNRPKSERPAGDKPCIDAKLVGAVDMPYTVPTRSASEPHLRVTTWAASWPPCIPEGLRFTGALKQTTFDLCGDLIGDRAADLTVAMHDSGALTRKHSAGHVRENPDKHPSGWSYS
jgi:hypothetical protein